MTDQRRRAAALALLSCGLLSVLGGGAVYAQAWYGAWSYSHSDRAEQAARQLAALETRPRWIEESAEDAGATFVAERESQRAPERGVQREVPPDSSTPSSRMLSSPPSSAAESRAEPTADETLPRSLARSGAPSPSMTPVATATPVAAASEIELRGSEFRFFDPPEPGAHARLAIRVRNGSAAPTEPLGLIIPAGWFAGYEVIGAIPAVLDDRPAGEAARRFEFPPLEPGADVTLELHLTATDEDLSAPELRLETASGAELGTLRPEIVAPRPRPGPARAVSIPRLGLRASVVPTVWEPPSFVIGQIRGSANLSQGNTVLIGHFRGPAGNVFAQLDRLQPGDEVIAVSRGLEYRFMVSDQITLPNHDTGPIQETATPRLTMMTCTGTWNPFTDDYSHRLWVIAEPPELARETIAANAARAAEASAAAQATAVAAQEQAREREREAAAVAEHERQVAAAAAAPAALEAPSEAVAPAPAALEPPTTEPMDDAPVVEDPATVAPGEPERPAAAAAPAAGLAIRSPAADAKVAARLVVKGSRALPVDPELHAWLFVRAEIEGSKWYPHPREIEAGPDGRWDAELVLGGRAGVRHELRLGVVDTATHEALLQHLAEHPNEPLDELPAGFAEEVSLFVTKR